MGSPLALKCWLSFWRGHWMGGQIQRPSNYSISPSSKRPWLALRTGHYPRLRGERDSRTPVARDLCEKDIQAEEHRSWMLKTLPPRNDSCLPRNAQFPYSRTKEGPLLGWHGGFGATSRSTSRRLRSQKMFPQADHPLNNRYLPWRSERYDLPTETQYLTARMSVHMVSILCKKYFAQVRFFVQVLMRQLQK